uniref:Uncharacterized protein n=1 Tax=viral metagenome TaxID=1070528 RepID=A0A6C0H9W7_9ZZZZ
MFILKLIFKIIKVIIKTNNLCNIKINFNNKLY